MKGQDIAPELIEAVRQQIAAMKQEIAAEPAGAGLVPLEIKCAMTSCQHGRHCLDHIRRPRAGELLMAPGSCRDCGSPVVSLPEPGGRKYGDDEEVLRTCTDQQSELIRAHYWQVPIDQWAYNQALRYGKLELVRRLERQVSAAMDPDNSFAGRGASYSGKIVAYAQHATATCCRRCAAYWHGTPAADGPEPLTTAQLRHLIKVARTYIDVRLPDLYELPAAVAAIHRQDLFGPGERASIDEAVFDELVAGRDPVGVVVPIGTSIDVEPARQHLLISRRIESAKGA
jgi:hypothetical protein